MRIVSWNVNGLRAALKKGFLEWFKHARPDVVCLQESRAFPGDVEGKALAPKGYKAFWNPAHKKGYSGTVTFTKREPLSVRTLGVDNIDAEGRVQALEFSGLTVVNAYFPNSQPERARLDYKLAFCEAILAFCNELRAAGNNVLLCGDYNIAHKEIDLARPKDNVDSPGFLPEERAAMDTFLGAGYIDAFRHFNREPGQYTWWSYRGNARRNNVGWRIDYHCVNEEFLPRVKQADILSDVTGSDHCPVSITVR